MPSQNAFTALMAGDPTGSSVSIVPNWVRILKRVGTLTSSVGLLKCQRLESTQTYRSCFQGFRLDSKFAALHSCEAPMSSE